MGELFGKYGNLRRVSVRRNFAFVEFDELSDASEAKSKLSGYHFRGKDLIVRYAASPDDKIREDELNARQNRRRAAIAARNAARAQQRTDEQEDNEQDKKEVTEVNSTTLSGNKKGNNSYSRSPSSGRRRTPSPFYQTKRTPTPSRSRSRSRGRRRSRGRSG